MFKWIDKQDDIDFVLAKDINDIAHSVIELEKTAVKVVDQTYTPDSENAQSGKAVAEAVSDKQDSLVSGTNIKTINNQSILGSGNITIEGGSGSSITIDQTFDPESKNAQSGKAVAEAVATEQKRADNTFANALKCSKSGSAILIDDISPVTHEIGVKVRCKNLFDLTSILNASNWDKSLTVKGYGNYPITGLIPNTKYTLSMSSNGWRGVADNSFYVSVRQDAGSWVESNSICHDDGSSIHCQNTVTIKSNENGVIYFSFYYVTNERLSAFFEKCPDIQLELGTTATAYTPYVPDLTAVKVTRYGKNLFDFNKVQNATLTTYMNKPCFSYVDGAKYFIYTSNFKEDTQYTFTTKGYREDGAINSPIHLWLWYTDGTRQSLVLDAGIIGSVTSEAGKTLTKISGGFNYGLDCYIDLSVTQIEVRTTASEYEPYKEYVEYTPNADGTVNGVTILYPNTTLMTDTEGVLIDCEYNRDLNKAFAALEAAIATNNS